MRKKINLLYLTYHENILYSGILYTQVVRMLESMRQKNKAIEITLLSFLSPQSLFRGWRELIDLKKRFKAQNIRLILLPMLVPAFWHGIFHFLMLLWLIPVLMVIRRYHCNILHPRGYVTAWFSLIANRLTGVPFIFDPRGEFPRERVFNGVWKETGMTYKFWTWLENKFIRLSSCVIGVTPEYRDLYLSRGAAKACFIPNRADTARFAEAVNRFRASEEFKNMNERYQLLYTGEFHTVWNHPKLVAPHFNALKRMRSEANLLLISRSDREEMKRILRDYNVDIDSVVIKGGSPVKMPELMQGSTLGLVFLAENVVSIWPVKFAEYLAAGIPVVSESSMKGLIVRILVEKKLGMVIDLNRESPYERIDDLAANWHEYSDRCLSYAKRRLDISSTARQFLRIYRDSL